MPTRSILLIAALIFSRTAFPQSLSIGLIGGAAVTDGFRTQTIPVEFPNGGFVGIRYFSASKDYIAGASIEFRVTRHWSLEADGLFRELHLTWAAIEPNGSLNSISPSPVVTWEFPLLAKYRFRLAKLSPFVEAGRSYRTAGNLNGTYPSSSGVTAGIGVEKNLRSLKLAPVVRYTYWASTRSRRAPTPPSPTITRSS